MVPDESMNMFVTPVPQTRDAAWYTGADNLPFPILFFDDEEDDDIDEEDNFDDMEDDFEDDFEDDDFDDEDDDYEDEEEDYDYEEDVDYNDFDE
ncbi:MAG: hypothetical protein LBK08_11235 [Treponema sp.]|jgi:hypothetical protein|nr:hypothetical protein [Treponema sp.]